MQNFTHVAKISRHTNSVDMYSILGNDRYERFLMLGPKGVDVKELEKDYRSNTKWKEDFISFTIVRHFCDVVGVKKPEAIDKLVMTGTVFDTELVASFKKNEETGLLEIHYGKRLYFYDIDESVKPPKPFIKNTVIPYGKTTIDGKSWKYSHYSQYELDYTPVTTERAIINEYPELVENSPSLAAVVIDTERETLEEFLEPEWVEAILHKDTKIPFFRTFESFYEKVEELNLTSVIDSLFIPLNYEEYYNEHKKNFNKLDGYLYLLDVEDMDKVKKVKKLYTELGVEEARRIIEIDPADEFNPVLTSQEIVKRLVEIKETKGTHRTVLEALNAMDLHAKGAVSNKNNDYYSKQAYAIPDDLEFKPLGDTEEDIRNAVMAIIRAWNINYDLSLKGED